MSRTASALDIKGTVGLHDNYLPGPDHHTFGVGLGLYAEHESESKIKSSAYFDWFNDDDNEEIDDDRYSNWFQAGFSSTGPIMNYNDNVCIDWGFDGEMRYNTVSSIEAFYRALPGMIASYKEESYSVGIGLYGGYYYHEWDDDIPKSIGYPAQYAKYESLVYSLKGNVRVDLNKDLEFLAVAQQWREDETWAQDQVKLDFVYDLSPYTENSEFIINSEYNRYNLKLYEPVNGVGLAEFRDDEWNFRTYARIAF